jgi:hypothetical protein
LTHRHPAECEQQAALPVDRQCLPNRAGEAFDHRAIQASAPRRTMPGTQAAGVRRVVSTLQRYFVWDIERAFRCIKTVDLHVRPVHHWLADRVRAHVFLCMLAYHLEWHMRQRLAPMLFDDTDKDVAEAIRASVVAQAQRSPAAVAKQTTGLTEDGLPVHSFHSLLADLATVVRNTITTAIAPNYPLTVLTRPTPIQQKAFALLGVSM